MKRGKRFLALVLSMSMLLVAFPIDKLQARTTTVTTTQEQELFSDDFDSYTSEDVAVNKDAMIEKGWRSVSNTAAGYATGDAYTIPHNGNYNLALSNLSEAATWTNYVVEATLEFDSSGTTTGLTAAGIAGRLYDATNVKSGYDLIVIKSSLTATNATLRLRCDGTELVSKNVTCPEVDTSFILRLEFDGTVIKGYLNDGDEITYDTVNDTTKYASGYAGIRKQNSTGYTTSFDNFKVYTIQEVPVEREILYSLNGNACIQNGDATETVTDTDTFCLYYDTFTVEDGYTAALGGKDVTGVASYNEANQNLSVGGFKNAHRIIPFYGISDVSNNSENASALQNYTIAADFAFKTETTNALGGVAAYTNGTVNGNGSGYEFSVNNGNLTIRNRKSGSSLVESCGSISDYFSEYVLGDTIRLSLAVVNNDDDTTVSVLGTITYKGEEKFVGMYTDTAGPIQGIPALRGYYPNVESTEEIYTADNVLVEIFDGDLASYAVEKFGYIDVYKTSDVNSDGESNSDDMVEMRKILVTASEIEFYDVNGDESCDVIDLVSLKKYLDKLSN